MESYYRVYCRVSTVDQKRGYSLEHQEEVIRKYKPKGFLEEVYIEAKSGKNVDERPGMQKLLNDLKEGDQVGVYDVSRLGRNTEENLVVAREIIAKGATLSVAGNIYDHTSPSAELQLTIESAIGAFQRKVQHNKSISGIEIKKEKGEWIFSPRLYGWNHTKKGIKINEQEAKTIRFIFDSYGEGRSIFWICNKLKDNGVRTRGGTPFLTSTVYRMLYNPIYAGHYYLESRTPMTSCRGLYGQSRVTSVYYEPIVPIDLYDRCNENHRTLERKHSRQFQYRNKPYFLTSMLKCKECGTKYVHTFRKHKDKVFPNFRTVHEKGCSCNVFTLSEDIFSALFQHLFKLIFLYPLELINHLTEETEKLKKSNQEIEVEIKYLKNLMAEKQEEKEKLVDAIMKIGMDGMMQKKIEDLNLDVDGMQDQIVQLEKSKATIDSDYFDYVLEDFKEMEILQFDHSDDAERNRMLKKYFEVALVENDKITVTTIHGLSFIVNITRNSRQKVLPESIKIYLKEKAICLLSPEMKVLDVFKEHSWSEQVREELQRKIDEIFEKYN